jgi:hypothetical protein
MLFGKILPDNIVLVQIKNPIHEWTGSVEQGKLKSKTYSK